MIPKIKQKNSKNQIEIAACEQKTTSEKANFCSNTVFSLYFKIGAKKSRHKNLISKIMKICAQILKNIAGRIPEATPESKLHQKS